MRQLIAKLRKLTKKKNQIISRTIAQLWIVVVVISNYSSIITWRVKKKKIGLAKFSSCRSFVFNFLFGVVVVVIVIGVVGWWSQYKPKKKREGGGDRSSSVLKFINYK